jgi:hypothetical protein
MGRGGDPFRQFDEEKEVLEEDRLPEAFEDDDDGDDGVVGRVAGGEGEVRGEVVGGCLQDRKNFSSYCMVAVL